MADIEMVDDYFWLKFAKDHIADALTIRDTAAKNLDTYLKFIWPIYTGFFAVSTAFSILPGPFWARIIMGLPVIIIPIASFYCVKVQLPIFTQFHANEPDSIVKDLYIKVVEQKNKDLTAAKVWVLIAAFSIGVSIFLFRLGDRHLADYSVKVSAQPENKSLRIQALLPAKQAASFTVTGYDTSGKIMHAVLINQTIADANGNVDTLIAGNDIIKNMQVFCAWQDDKKQTHTISFK